MTPLEVLKAILKEVDGPGRPLDGNSYLPPSLVFMARDVIENPETRDWVPASDEALETLIEESGGYWKEDVFCIEAGDLMNMLRATSITSGTGGNDGR